MDIRSDLSLPAVITTLAPWWSSIIQLVILPVIAIVQGFDIEWDE